MAHWCAQNSLIGHKVNKKYRLPKIAIGPLKLSHPTLIN